LSDQIDGCGPSGLMVLM